MNHYDDHAPIWDDKTAEWYAAEYGDHISNVMTIKHAGLKVDDDLLDIGCGSGTACREAEKTITKGTITGIAPTAAMIRIAKEKTFSKNIQFIEGSVENIPTNDESITICTAINSLHHWSDYKKGFAEVLRILKQKGRFFISDEIVAGDSCGHGDRPLANPEKVQMEIEKAGFVNISLDIHEENGEGIYLFKAEKS